MNFTFHIQIQVKPKRPRGGGAAAAHRSQDRLPFLTGSSYVHKNSWLCPYASQLEVGKVIFLLSWQVFQKFSRDRQKITIFWDRKTRNWLFFIFFQTKVCNFVSNINEDCSQLSFEVYNVFVAQKLKILENAKHFFHIWTLATSVTSRGLNLTSATSIGSQILAEDTSFHMKHCLWTKMKIRGL